MYIYAYMCAYMQHVCIYELFFYFSLVHSSTQLLFLFSLALLLFLSPALYFYIDLFFLFTLKKNPSFTFHKSEVVDVITVVNYQGHIVVRKPFNFPPHSTHSHCIGNWFISSETPPVRPSYLSWFYREVRLKGLCSRWFLIFKKILVLSFLIPLGLLGFLEYNRRGRRSSVPLMVFLQTFKYECLHTDAYLYSLQTYPSIPISCETNKQFSLILSKCLLCSILGKILKQSQWGRKGWNSEQEYIAYDKGVITKRSEGLWVEE